MYDYCSSAMMKILDETCPKKTKIREVGDLKFISDETREIIKRRDIKRRRRGITRRYEALRYEAAKL